VNTDTGHSKQLLSELVKEYAGIEAHEDREMAGREEIKLRFKK